MRKESWLKEKKATASFGIIAFIGGFLSLNKSLTGNAIVENKAPITLLSAIGLLLILCSIVLFIYTIKKR